MSEVSNTEDLVLLEKLATDKVVWIRCAVAENPNTPVVLLEKLATDEESTVKESVARNPNTPVVLLEKLATDRKSDARGAVVGNSNTPVVLLEKLATDKVVWIRGAVAKNPNTPVASLEKLATDRNSDVRGAVAKNPNTPTVLLEKLATDEDDYVRSAVAENPNTPVVILEKLATDENDYVRGAVAKNPNTPTVLLETVAADPVNYVREVATRYSSIFDLDDQLDLVKEAVSKVVAENSNSSLAILQELARNKKWQVRVAAEENPNFSFEGVSAGKLLQDLEEYESLDITQRKSLLIQAKEYFNTLEYEAPFEWSEDLYLEDADFPLIMKLREIAAEEEGEELLLILLEINDDDFTMYDNTDSPEYVGVRHALLTNNPYVTRHLSRFVELGTSFLRERIASGQGIPSEILEKLALDEDINLRTAVFNNPSASHEIRASAALLGVKEDE